jgi:hypothetical protein
MSCRTQAARPATVDYSRFTSDYKIDREIAALTAKLAHKTITPYEKAQLDYLQRLSVWRMLPAYLRDEQPPLPPTPVVEGNQRRLSKKFQSWLSSLLR